MMMMMIMMMMMMNDDDDDNINNGQICTSKKIIWTETFDAKIKYSCPNSVPKPNVDADFTVYKAA